MNRVLFAAHNFLQVDHRRFYLFMAPCYHSRQEPSLSYGDRRVEEREKDARRHPNKADKISE